MKKARENEETRKIEKEKDTEARRKARENADVRHREAERDQQARQVLREDPVRRDAERQRRMERAAERTSYSVMYSEFKKRIKQGPTHVCCCCGQLMFKSSVTIHSEVDVAAKNIYSGWIEICNVQRTEGESLTLCSTCRKYLLKDKKVPPMAASNGFLFPAVPEEFREVEVRPLEERFVSARIPFMQIREKGVTRQRALRGSCVNVPVDVNTFVSALPRRIADSHTVFVSLVRRMRDTHAYASDFVRIDVVHKLAQYLVGKPVYTKNNVVFDEGYLRTLEAELRNLQDTLDMGYNNSADQDQEVDGEFVWNELTEEEEILAEHETLLDEVNLVSADTGIRIAPGENRIPTSLLFDDNVEELSFPTIYWGEERKITSNVSIVQIAKAEARMFDRRCSTNIPKLFMMFSRLRRYKIANQISLALRKKRRQNTVTVRDILNTAYVDDLVQHNDGYRILQVDRSSPPYWEQKKKTVFAMYRQFGLPSLFVTFSCAETRCVELVVVLMKTLKGVEISEEEAQEMSWEEKVQLVQDDPVTVTRYMHRRFKEMWKVFVSQGGPLKDYNVSQSFVRVEFQHRGTMHFHCLLFIDGAPQYDSNVPESMEVCIQFIDELITCQLDESLGDLVNVQFHRHSRTCHKIVRGVRHCRFGVPFPPMRRTVIVFPLDETVSEEEKRAFSARYRGLQQRMLELHRTREDMNFDDFLAAVPISEEHYMEAIGSQVRRAKVFLRRDLKEIKLNAYNKLALILNEANMDIQFMVDPYGAATYVVDYVNKPERGVSKLIKETADQVRLGNAPLVEQMRSISNVFINKSEVSAQEACIHILGLSMAEASVAEVYINTSPPDVRVRLQKPAAQLERLLEENPDSSDVFASGLVEHYEQRPNCLEGCCLADFAALYTFHVKKRGKQVRAEIVNDDENIDAILEETEEFEQNLAVGIEKDLPLKDGTGFVSRRAKGRDGKDNPKLIRYVNYVITHDPDNFMREQVMLFLPWRSEGSIVSNCRRLFNENQEVIRLNREKYVRLNVDMEELLRDVLDQNAEDDESDEDDNNVPEEFAVFEADRNLPADIGQDVGPDVLNVNGTSEQFLLPRHLPEDEYLECIARLNEKQRRYHLNLVHILKTRPDEQIFQFVSGGAGVGKSVLIKAITQSAIRIFIKHFDCHPDETTVVRMAPTGKAAFGMEGMTINSVLHIFSQNMDMVLGPDALNTLRAQLRHTRLFIIDEVSMVGRRMFGKVNDRLQEVFGNKKCFGGRSVIVFGDFNQLPPVQDQWVFQSGSDPLSVLAGSYLWSNFSYFELTQIMRQRDDAVFAEALGRLATGECNSADDAMFASREMRRLDSRSIHPPNDALELFTTNEFVEHRNTQYLASVNSGENEMFTSYCWDKCEGEGSDRVKQKELDRVKSWPLSKTQNLPQILLAKVGAPYMVTVNIKTEDGLTNGAHGVLRHIAWGRTGNGERAAIRLYVEFRDESVGQQTRSDNFRIMQADGVNSRWTPVERISRVIIPRKGSMLKVVRKQFPLVPAKAITIHKSQGATEKVIVVHISTLRRMNRRTMYVAFSRVTSLDGLFINGVYNRPAPPSPTDPVQLEIRRLKLEENAVKMLVRFPELCTRVDGVKVVALFHNIRSLHKHHGHLLNDLSYTGVDLLLLCETWTMPDDNICIPGFVLLHRRDCVKETRHAYGTVLYVKEWLAARITMVFNEDSLKVYKGSHLHAFIDVIGFCVDSGEVRTGIMYLHKSPQCSVMNFKKHVENCLQSLQNHGVDNIVVVGDFNINVQDEKGAQFLKNFLSPYGLTLCTSENTVTTDNNTVIDMCFSNIQDFVAYITESVISDHKPLWFVLG
uniref:ATP-dependent DNA helicase n=2 Tax=Cacopsylla melanoneura TaxID=428564 RepID=A0A8D8WGM7_9HEMI